MFFIRLPMTMSAPFSQLLHEARDLVEVIGEVGVGHDDVVASRGGEAGHVGAAVAALGLVDDDRARGGGETRAVVLGIVVGDDHLAGEAALVERLARSAHALARSSPPR